MDLLTWMAVVRRDVLADSARHLVWNGGDLLAACDDGSVCLATDGVEVRHRLDAPPTALVVGAGVVLCGALDGRAVVLATSGAASVPLPGSIAAATAAGNGFVVAHGDLLTVVDTTTSVDGTLRPGMSVDPGIGTITVLDRVAGRIGVVGGTHGCAWFDSGFCSVDDRHALPTIVALAVDRRHGRVALGDLGGSIHLLRTDRAELVELTGYPDRVGLLCWTADGHSLCAAAADEVTVWTPDTDDDRVDGTAGTDQDSEVSGEPVRLVGHDDAITALSASPTDGLVASGDTEGRVCIWAPGRLETPVGSLTTDGIVLALAWRHDGRSLAVSTSEGSLVVAHVRPGAVV